MWEQDKGRGTTGLFSQHILCPEGYLDILFLGHPGTQDGLTVALFNHPWSGRSKASGPQSSPPGTPAWHCRKTDPGILSGTPGSEGDNTSQQRETAPKAEPQLGRDQASGLQEDQRHAPIPVPCWPTDPIPFLLSSGSLLLFFRSQSHQYLKKGLPGVQ